MIDDNLKQIKEIFDRKEQKIKDLQEENARLKSERYKDEELAKLQSRIDDYEKAARRSWEMTEKEYKEYRDFIEEHYNKHQGMWTKANGYVADLSVHGTGIGLIWKCQCLLCKETKEIADIDS